MAERKKSGSLSLSLFLTGTIWLSNSHFPTLGAFACSGFSRLKWISAKLHKSVTEMRDPKREAQLSSG